MPTLFDSLSKRLTDAASKPPSFAPQQSTIAAGLRAKSGKAPTTGGAPAASNLGEQAATGAATAAVDQAGLNSALAGAKVGQAAEAQQGKIDNAQAGLNAQVADQRAQQQQNAQLAGEATVATENAASEAIEFQQARKTDEINHVAEQQLRGLAAERGTSVDNIFRDFEASEKELSFRKDAAELEQVGFHLAMQDKAYIDEVNRIGFERDLNDRLNFREEAQDLIFGSNLSQLVTDLGAQEKLNASQREWDVYISSIDINAAINIASATAKDEGKTAMIGAAGTLGKAGVDAYVTSSAGGFDSDYQQWKEDGNKGSYATWKEKHGGNGPNTDTATGGSFAPQAYVEPNMSTERKPSGFDPNKNMSVEDA